MAGTHWPWGGVRELLAGAMEGSAIPARQPALPSVDPEHAGCAVSLIRGGTSPTEIRRTRMAVRKLVDDA